MDRYEPGTWEAFIRILRPGDHHIEVGAHVGVFACLAAALVGESGGVTAFEPDKQNFHGLVKNKAANGFTHLDVKPWAVSDHAGPTVFYRCADNDGGHAIYDPGKQAGNPLTRQNPSRRIVQAVTLDEMIDHPVRLIKSDVEGAECAVLRGATMTIQRHRPAIIAEMNHVGLSCMGETETTLRELLRRFDYREYAIQDAPPHFLPLTPEQTINNRIEREGKVFLNVYNLLAVPVEWPEF